VLGSHVHRVWDNMLNSVDLLSQSLTLVMAKSDILNEK
jgi:hypothetical protein